MNVLRGLWERVTNALFSVVIPDDIFKDLELDDEAHL